MKRILITGEKESIFTRILLKKLQDAGMNAGFTAWNVDAIASAWENAGVIVLPMENGVRPGDAALHFLIDRLVDGKLRLIPVGDEDDIRYLRERVPEKLIFQSFARPVDYAALVGAAAELLDKEASGELRKSILIVDDDPGYLNLVRDWLKESYQVAMATSGTQAIRWLGRNRADLILLDYEMPVTSGPQVLEMLRSDEETRDVPVIFLTGKSDRESVLAVMSMKPDGYFLKSIERGELLARLEEYFALHV